MLSRRSRGGECYKRLTLGRQLINILPVVKRSITSRMTPCTHLSNFVTPGRACTGGGLRLPSGGPPTTPVGGRHVCGGCVAAGALCQPPVVSCEQSTSLILSRFTNKHRSPNESPRVVSICCGIYVQDTYGLGLGTHYTTTTE